MVMASNLVTAASTFQVTDPDFEKNLQGFIHQCVFYDLMLHKYSSQELFTATQYLAVCDGTRFSCAGVFI